MDVRCYSKAFMTEFIELYKSLPALWKVKSKEYSDRNKKNEAYKVLVQKFREVEPEADRNLITRKINSIRSCYRKEKKKITDSVMSGTDDVYVPSLWYFNLLQFVDDQNTAQESLSYFEDDQEESYSIDYDEDYSNINQDVESPASTLPPRREKRKREVPNNVEVDSILCSMDKRMCVPQAEDQHDIYGKIIAHKMRDLPKEQRIYAEKIINDALFEAQLGNLTRHCRLDVPHQHTFPAIS